MTIIDTHAHVYGKKFSEDLALVVNRAASVGVKKILLPNIDSTSIEDLHTSVAAFPDVFIPMMGVHPCSINENSMEELTVAKNALDSGRYCAVGEIGLDYYWDKTFIDKQQEAFSTQIVWAKEKHLPIAIHSRNAEDDCIQIVKQYKDENLCGVFHCFSGNAKQAAEIIELDFYLGIGGVATYKNSPLNDVIRELGIEKVVIETDSPYLTPVPHRGKRNEPSYTIHIVEHLAQLLSISREEVAEITTKNAVSLFGLKN
jgi:TatD DNase family protein